ncbi:putative matrix metalloproteinase-11 [Diaporthe ampelina]|uniref:Putative matrix metalloproteinase-11 n=1 Tax=Diaporthe ampelina TaxID=1214573 RepID=A0A0G2IE07_9PEZI|nr:putative matrix metalloproteinase-11 [Diaporthe ampelina]
MAVTEGPRRYSCSTQKNLKAELLPPQQAADGERPPVGNDDESIVVGVGKEVPRWDVVKQGPRQLKYFVQATKFPSSQRAKDVGEAFQQAADLWNAMNLGISIVAASDAANAHFDLCYWNPNDPRDTTLAKAFFPNEKNQNVWVYDNALQPNNSENLVSIFAHEIGHILGLRHEFAITGDQDKNLKAEFNGATQFMEPNYYSVMSYNFPPTIRDTDIKGIQAFYKLKNGETIGDLPVTDYVPVLKERKA